MTWVRTVLLKIELKCFSLYAPRAEPNMGRNKATAQVKPKTGAMAGAALAAQRAAQALAERRKKRLDTDELDKHAQPKKREAAAGTVDTGSTSERWSGR